MYKDINIKIQNQEEDYLRSISFHCVDNAWSNINFCDFKRGIYGATPAEIMHCFQQGLYEYIIKELFEQKKIKVNSEKKRKVNEIDNLKEDTTANDIEYNWTHDAELSRNFVFGSKYCKYFDNIARTYGFLLMHQSDRNLPRTHFQTNYTSVGYKNANEMSGIFIVILMVFASIEGENLDRSLSNERSSQYIHLFEIMLLTENFCKHDMHSKKI